jgi:hypothetical protein
MGRVMPLVLYKRLENDGPELMLLHGLGQTGAVWDGLTSIVEREWAGGCIVPELPGHGGSPGAANYSFGGIAAAIAGVLDRSKEHIVVGHSLGGVVGLVLASGWFGMEVSHTIGGGIKVAWTTQELEQAASLARRPRAGLRLGRRPLGGFFASRA